VKYLSKKPPFSQVKSYYESEMEGELGALATLLKKTRKARTLDRFEEVLVLSERSIRKLPPRNSGAAVDSSWDFKHLKASHIAALEYNKTIAAELLKQIRRADTPARLKKAILKIDKAGYAQGIACVTLRSFDGWVQQMGYHPNRPAGD